MIMTGNFRTDGKLLKDEIRDKLKAVMETLPRRIQVFAHDKCVLSGGCFASILHNEPVNDWDLWCADDADIPEMERILSTYTKEEADMIPVENPAYMEAFVDGKLVTVNAITLKNKVQFIKLNNFAKAKATFDLEHCRISYIPATNVLYMSKAQYESIHTRKLVMTGVSSSINEKRLGKFYGRGWSLK